MYQEWKLKMTKMNLLALESMEQTYDGLKNMCFQINQSYAEKNCIFKSFHTCFLSDKGTKTAPFHEIN